MGEVRIGSLFSGAGGLDMAVESVFGGHTRWVCEFDQAASKVLAHRFPDAPNLGDITKVDWDQIARENPVDVLCGGFPCQDVSTAGRRAGLGDGTRSGLWAQFAGAIEALRPKYVVIENVRGLVSATAHRQGEDEDGDSGDVEPGEAALGDGSGKPVLRAAGAVLGDLADLGYDAQWLTVTASSVGAPHRRERIFILAHPAGELWDWTAADAERGGLDSRVAGASVEGGEAGGPADGGAPVGGEPAADAAVGGRDARVAEPEGLGREPVAGAGGDRAEQPDAADAEGDGRGVRDSDEPGQAGGPLDVPGDDRGEGGGPVEPGSDAVDAGHGAGRAELGVEHDVAAGGPDEPGGRGAAGGGPVADADGDAGGRHPGGVAQVEERPAQGGRPEGAGGEPGTVGVGRPVAGGGAAGPSADAAGGAGGDAELDDLREGGRRPGEPGVGAGDGAGDRGDAAGEPAAAADADGGGLDRFGGAAVADGAEGVAGAGRALHVDPAGAAAADAERGGRVGGGLGDAVEGGPGGGAPAGPPDGPAAAVAGVRLLGILRGEGPAAHAGHDGRERVGEAHDDDGDHARGDVADGRDPAVAAAAGRGVAADPVGVGRVGGRREAELGRAPGDAARDGEGDRAGERAAADADPDDVVRGRQAGEPREVAAGAAHGRGPEDAGGEPGVDGVGRGDEPAAADPYGETLGRVGGGQHQEQAAGAQADHGPVDHGVEPGTVRDGRGAGVAGGGRGTDAVLGRSLFPTPTATDCGGAESRAGEGFRPQLGQVVRELGVDELLPTPRATQFGPGSAVHPNGTRKSGLSLEEALLPTPSASDGAGGKTSRSGDRKDELLLGGLVRTFVEDQPVLPTPQTVNRASRRAMLGIDDPTGGRRHWAQPGLEQALEIAQGILPKEFESWDEVPGASRPADEDTLLPTPAARDFKGVSSPSWRAREGAKSTPTLPDALFPPERPVEDEQPALLPTPCAGLGSGTNVNNGGMVNLFPPQPGDAELLPTPTVMDTMASGDRTLEWWDGWRDRMKSEGYGSNGPRGDSLGAAAIRLAEDGPGE